MNLTSNKKKVFIIVMSIAFLGATTLVLRQTQFNSSKVSSTSNQNKLESNKDKLESNKDKLESNKDKLESNKSYDTTQKSEKLSDKSKEEKNNVNEDLGLEAMIEKRLKAKLETPTRLNVKPPASLPLGAKLVEKDPNFDIWTYSYDVNLSESAKIKKMTVSKRWENTQVSISGVDMSGNKFLGIYSEKSGLKFLFSNPSLIQQDYDVITTEVKKFLN